MPSPRADSMLSRDTRVKEFRDGSVNDLWRRAQQENLQDRVRRNPRSQRFPGRLSTFRIRFATRKLTQVQRPSWTGQDCWNSGIFPLETERAKNGSLQPLACIPRKNTRKACSQKHQTDGNTNRDVRAARLSDPINNGQISNRRATMRE